MQKNINYTVVSAAGNRIVLIDNKITFTKVLKTKAILLCQRLSEWFEEGTIEDIMLMFVLFSCATMLYAVAAV